MSGTDPDPGGLAPDALRNTKEIIRALLRDLGEVSTGDVTRATGLSRQAIYYHLARMLADGEISSRGARRGTRYRLNALLTETHALAGLREDEVWRELLPRIESEVGPLSENARRIFDYAFTEMLNNAIDHSMGTEARVSVRCTDRVLTIEIEDDGRGVFRTVRDKFGLEDDFAAIQQLSKGKQTTQPDRHTGEGIFFTSKAVDRFRLESRGTRWEIDNQRGDQAIGHLAPNRPSGTRVSWSLALDTKRLLRDVFDAYTNPETLDFSTTTTDVRLFSVGDSFVSRSEAKRLAAGLEDFREVRVDFAGVAEVGQGFVDELFRVWASQHPRTRLVPINMAPLVEALIRRGLPSRGST